MYRPWVWTGPSMALTCGTASHTDTPGFWYSVTASLAWLVHHHIPVCPVPLQAATAASMADSFNDTPSEGDGFTYEHYHNKEVRVAASWHTSMHISYCLSLL